MLCHAKELIFRSWALPSCTQTTLFFLAFVSGISSALLIALQGVVYPLNNKYTKKVNATKGNLAVNTASGRFYRGTATTASILTSRCPLRTPGPQRLWNSSFLSRKPLHLPRRRITEQLGYGNPTGRGKLGWRGGGSQEDSCSSRDMRDVGAMVIPAGYSIDSEALNLCSSDTKNATRRFRRAVRSASFCLRQTERSSALYKVKFRTIRTV